ncbi:MAG: DUF3566 domain-containing protein, partial [Acidimicrobiales bacterium]
MPDPVTPPLPVEYGAIQPGTGGAAERAAAPGNGTAGGRRGRIGLPAGGPQWATTTRAARPSKGPRLRTGRAVGRPRAPHSNGAAAAGPGASRKTLRRVRTSTVFKVSLMFYLCGVVVVVISGVVLWNAASALGFLHSIEKSIRTLFSYSTFTLHPGPLLLYTGVGGVFVA